MSRITIIDGNSLLFRGYYATAYPGVEIMRSQDGTPTNAIFAFSNMINKILSDVTKDEMFFVAFDAGKHNFRHDSLESYKANRKPAPEDLVKQFPLVRELLSSLGVFQFEEIGFEGDDIAGSVAKLAEKEGHQVRIFTSDRDFLQLVTSNISVHILKKGLSDVSIMTPEKVKEEYGFEPLQIIDYKGLRGDTSDNLPGIPGIGDKTAVKLIQEYKTFDNIIANVDNIKGKIKDSIIQHKDVGRISRDLAVIKTDIELPFSLEDTLYKGYDFSKLNSFCQKYGLRQFINKVNPKWKKRNEDIQNLKIDIIKDASLYMFPDTIGIYLDFENEEDYTKSDIYGIGVYFDNHFLYEKFEDFKSDVFLQNVLKNEKIKKCTYDFKAIKVALSFHGHEINGLSFDVLLAAYLIDSSIKNSPDAIMNLFDIDLSNKEDTVSLLNQNNSNRTVKIAYHCYSLIPNITKQLTSLSALDLYYNLEIPLAEVLSDMEIEGFPLDVNILDNIGKDYKNKIEELSNEIYELAGEKFNISSSKQVGEILFNKLGITTNKKMSTSYDILKDLTNEHPIVEKILEYRKYFKLVSTYTEGLKNHVHKDGKIHAKFNQALTQTGRLSSSDPNLQNISIRSNEGKAIRKAFFYHESDALILSLDYSQIELRVLSSLAKCKSLIDSFNEGRDIHEETARRIFNLQDEVSDEYRRKAKTVNFGIVYGISDWGLADQLSIPVFEAKRIINSFYETYPEIGTFFTSIVNEAMKSGYVSTLFSRRRYLRELHDANYQVREFAKRAAINAPIQGTAADMIKMAMIKISKAFKEKNIKSKMVLQIHDELIFKVYEEEKEIVFNLVKDIMENVVSLDVKLEVDGGYGIDWYSAK